MIWIRGNGLGGQGVVTLVNWVAMVGYQQGKFVQAFPFFGAERRGAPVKAFVRIDDDEIYLRSQIKEPDLLVIMSSSYTRQFLDEGISPQGQVLMNADEATALGYASELERKIFWVDAVEIALEHELEVDGSPMINVPMFGAICSQAKVCPFDAVKKVLGSKAKGPEGKKVLGAAQKGFEGVTLALPVSEMEKASS